MTSRNQRALMGAALAGWVAGAALASPIAHSTSSFVATLAWLLAGGLGGGVVFAAWTQNHLSDGEADA